MINHFRVLFLDLEKKKYTLETVNNTYRAIIENQKNLVENCRKKGVENFVHSEFSKTR